MRSVLSRQPQRNIIRQVLLRETVAKMDTEGAAEEADQFGGVNMGEVSKEMVVRTLHLFQNGKLDVDTAANTLSASLAEEGDLECLWGPIIDFAKQHPDSHYQLVELLGKFAVLPSVTLPTGELVVWRDLPYFGIEMSYIWEHYDVPSSEGPEREAAITEFNNGNRFTAIQAKSGKTDLQWWKFMLWTFRGALETEEYRPMIEGSRGPLPALDAEVPAAAILIREVGEMIFECEKDFPESEDATPGVGGTLWSGKHGFCRGRWDLWKRRFTEIAELSGVSPGTRATARYAAVEMQRIEAEHNR